MQVEFVPLKIPFVSRQINDFYYNINTMFKVVSIAGISTIILVPPIQCIKLPSKVVSIIQCSKLP